MSGRFELDQSEDAHINDVSCNKYVSSIYDQMFLLHHCYGKNDSAQNNNDTRPDWEEAYSDDCNAKQDKSE